MSQVTQKAVTAERDQETPVIFSLSHGSFLPTATQLLRRMDFSPATAKKKNILIIFWEFDYKPTKPQKLAKGPRRCNTWNCQFIYFTQWISDRFLSTVKQRLGVSPSGDSAEARPLTDTTRGTCVAVGPCHVQDKETHRKSKAEVLKTNVGLVLMHGLEMVTSESTPEHGSQTSGLFLLHHVKSHPCRTSSLVAKWEGVLAKPPVIWQAEPPEMLEMQVLNPIGCRRTKRKTLGEGSSDGAARQSSGLSTAMFVNDGGTHVMTAGLRGCLLGLGHRRSREPLLCQVVPLSCMILGPSPAGSGKDSQEHEAPSGSMPLLATYGPLKGSKSSSLSALNCGTE